ncbi:MAG: betaine-aldehyde dehydrogenase [Flavobacteriales bacterium]
MILYRRIREYRLPNVLNELSKGFVQTYTEQTEVCLHSIPSFAGFSENTMEATKSYINGAVHGSVLTPTFSNINPATGVEIGQVQFASSEDVDRAVESAKAGFRIWSQTSPEERARVLFRAAEILRERNDEIAKIEVEDTGKPIAEAIEVDVVSGIEAIEYFAGLATKIEGRRVDFGNSYGFTRKEPLGVCVGIGAWNYPIQIACWKSAPALACGNSMIFKPSEMTPRTAVILAEVYSEAGLPDGVFNVLQGGAEVGQALATHKDVAKISLTGEVGTGKKVMAAAAQSLKKVTLELGGKSPIIVFEDADIEQAVAGAMLGNFYTQGEICSNGTRVFVAASIKDKFLEMLIEKTQRMKVGNPMDPTTDVGALISKNHLNKVLEYMEIGKQEARLLCGGNQVQFADSSACNNGYFVEPTIFDCASDALRIVQEEIFGPVMSILTFEDEREVIERANDTEFGLAAGVFTANLEKGQRVVNQLQAGVCWINTYNITPVELPFGGYKQSGIGRENGTEAIDHYTQVKTVYVEMDGIENPYN